MAEAFRKNLRLLYKSGRLTKSEGMDQVEALREKLRRALLEPKLLEQLHSGKRSIFSVVFGGNTRL